MGAVYIMAVGFYTVIQLCFFLSLHFLTRFSVRLNHKAVKPTKVYVEVSNVKLSGGELNGTFRKERGDAMAEK